MHSGTRRISTLIFVLLAAFLLACGCCGPTSGSPPASGPSPSPSPSVPAGLSLPASRSFHLGFTPVPYDYTAEAVRETYEMTGAHTDLILHHFDQGVPWPEALDNKPYDPEIEADLNDRLACREPGQKLYLAVTPISSYRDQLAPYRGTEGNMPLPDDWKDRSFDDPAVVRAYTNYCRRMIEKFSPDYFAYGIEVNMLAQKDPAAYEEFVRMSAQVYQSLKTEYPGLPVFVSLHVDTYAGDRARQHEAIGRILPYTDYIAVSTYPYSVSPDPGQLPRDWFSQMRDLAPEKPFAVAETGFIAEDLVIPAYAASINGSEQWQAQYVSFLLDSANALDARFVVWFVPIDYDLLYRKLESAGMDPLVKMWRDTGLADGDRQPRPALGVWDAWQALPLR